MNYHRLIFDSEREDLFVIKKYEMAGYDLTSLWKGNEVDAFPADLKLVIDDRDGTHMADLIGNPISWLIVSDRLANILCPSPSKDDVQLLPAPIFKQSDGSRIDGYHVLNPLTAIRGLCENESKVSRSADGAIVALNQCVLSQALIPEDIEMFRLAEFKKAVFVSDRLAMRTSEKGIRGLAFIRCEAARFTC